MQSYCLSEVVRMISPTVEIEFYSSGPGLMWLAGRGAVVHELPTVPRSRSTLSYLLTQPSVGLCRAIHTDPPSALVVDGEPLILPVLRTFFAGPIVAMVNPAELAGRDSTEKEIFLTFLRSADAMICNSLEATQVSRPWPQSNLAAVELPPLVRREVLAARVARQMRTQMQRRSKESPLVAAVLGGGSMNDPAMELATRRIAANIVEVATSLPNAHFSVYSSDPSVQDLLAGAPTNVRQHLPDTCATAMGEASVVIARAGRNTIAEILTIGVPGILIPTDTLGLRGREQRRNATVATNSASQCLLLDPTDVEELRTTLRKQLKHCANPTPWFPGNSAMHGLLRGVPVAVHAN